MKKILLPVLTLVLVLGLASYNNVGSGHKGQELSGAGATFPLTFYNIVSEEFAHTTGSVVAYGGIVMLPPRCRRSSTSVPSPPGSGPSWLASHSAYSSRANYASSLCGGWIDVILLQFFLQ